ncbi:flagellar biosynthesis anti-sigma factor FlgM [Anaeromyxobacter paludicola]|uniref:Anti-sigma-28 factor FlgM C-terminal domain-containing protein n=1 Tax=Anaeromyxobacter paludicola TaxID=2918171 RepID=A0ABN6N7P2_9BACT|nr:flagellar biosynthesis anti-sigma factor FlgM [Anaeromyxobacter paludicola]BDG08010.1 hypothetical protein AMPC_11230 [Anaeromyxobacter paludicola]
MKVKNTSETTPIDGSRTTEARKASGADPSAPPERVSTPDSTKFAAAVDAARQHLGATRAAKLQSIAAAVKQGTYQPDPNQIAQEILDDAELTASLQGMLKRLK